MIIAGISSTMFAHWLQSRASRGRSVQGQSMNLTRRIFLMVTSLLLAGCAVTLNEGTPVPTAFVPSVAPPGLASATPGTGAGTAAPKWSALGLKGHLVYSLGVQ